MKTENGIITVFDQEETDKASSEDLGRNCIQKRKYLSLPLHEPSEISYLPTQGGCVREVEGLLEGRYFVDRKIRFSRLSFALTIFASIIDWRECGCFYMMHGGSKLINKLRGAVFIADDTLPPIDMTIYPPRKTHRDFCVKKEGRLILPVECFGTQAWKIIAEEGIICVFQEAEHLVDGYQRIFDDCMRAIPKTYL